MCFQTDLATSAAWAAATRSEEEKLEASLRAVLRSLMGLLDADGDGRLSLQEFVRLDELLKWGCGGGS